MEITLGDENYRIIFYPENLWVTWSRLGWGRDKEILRNVGCCQFMHSSRADWPPLWHAGLHSLQMCRVVCLETHKRSHCFFFPAWKQCSSYHLSLLTVSYPLKRLLYCWDTYMCWGGSFSYPRRSVSNTLWWVEVRRQEKGNFIIILSNQH